MENLQPARLCGHSLLAKPSVDFERVDHITRSKQGPCPGLVEVHELRAFSPDGCVVKDSLVGSGGG